MKAFLLPFLSMVVSVIPSAAQNLFVANHEDSLHLIQRVGTDSIFILTEEGEVNLPLANASVFLREVPEFLPGFLKIEDESMVETNEDDQNRTYGDLVFFRYQAKVTPNRDLENPFLVLRWVRSDNTAFVSAIPLTDFVAGEQQQVTHKLFVHERFKLIEPSVHFMAMGIEIGTSRVLSEPVTPYAYALQSAGGEKLADGNIKPIRMLPTPSVKDGNGNPVVGSVHIVMKVDPQGYVSSVHVRDYTDWTLAKACLMEAPLFLFQPKIVDGQPVSTGFVLPFRFK